MRLAMAGLIVASTAAAGSQSSSAQPPSKPPQPAKPVVVIGCLAEKRGGAEFTLTTTEADVKASKTAKPEVAAPAKPDVKTVVYTVTSPSGIDLRRHAGHTVEIIGTEP